MASPGHLKGTGNPIGAYRAPASPSFKWICADIYDAACPHARTATSGANWLPHVICASC